MAAADAWVGTLTVPARLRRSVRKSEPEAELKFLTVDLAHGFSQPSTRPGFFPPLEQGNQVQLYARSGGELLVNTTVNGDQATPAIARSGSGYVVVYANAGFISAQRYNVEGSRNGTELNLSASGTAGTEPVVVALGNGGFAVAWTAATFDPATMNTTFEIRGRVFDSSLSPLAAEFVVNSQTSGNQGQPSIAASGDRFLVTWTDPSGLGPDTSGSGIKAQLFSASGTRLGGELLVNTATVNAQSEPQVVGLANGGGFAVVWTDASRTGGDPAGTAITGQILDISGFPVGGPFLVNSQVAGNQQQPAIALLANGRFVVSWHDGSQAGGDGSGLGIKAQIFNADGTKAGGEFLVNVETSGDQSAPATTALPSGGFAISWQDLSGQADTSGPGIKAAIFDASGSRIGTEFLVNTSTFAVQAAPAIAGFAGDKLVVAWTDSSRAPGDTSGTAVRAQLFAASTAGPTDLALSTFAVREDAIEGKAAAILSSVGASNASFTYSIVSDSTGGAFGISGNRLIVLDNARLDADTSPGATLLLRVTDDNGNSYDESVALTITDAQPAERRFGSGAEIAVNTTTNFDST
jgi:hypothetical protein